MTLSGILTNLSVIMMFILGACSADEPVATKYKKNMGTTAVTGGGDATPDDGEGGGDGDAGLDPALVAQGVELYSSLGCTGCHENAVDGAGSLEKSGVYDGPAVEAAQGDYDSHPADWPAGDDAAALGAAFTDPEL